MSDALAIAVLAAGAATRFGGGKLDAPFRGRRLGEHALETVRRLGRPMIVTAPDAPDFALDAGIAGQADLLINPLAAQGLSTSVALAAVRARIAGADRLLLVLGDMPLVRAETLQALVALCQPGKPAAVRHPGGRLGIPACFAAEDYGRLEALSGDRGAGEWLSQPGAATGVDVAAEELRDIDRAEDLAMP